MSAHTYAILTDRLTKRYGKTTGCEDVSLAVPQGVVFGFLGPNGAGKSTVVKVLAGLHAATSGTAHIFGHPAGSLNAGHCLGFVPEMFGVPAWSTAAELLRFYGNLSDVPARELEGRIDEALERVGLPLNVRTKRVGGFSKGMRQRLCIAAALLHRPRLLLMDEPTSALDPVGRREVRDLIIALRQEGTTVLLNSHILSDVEMVADQIAIIRAGRIVMAGTPAELMGGSVVIDLSISPLTPGIERSLGSLGILEQLGAGRVQLRLHRAEDVGEIARLVVQGGARLLELTPHRQSLEDLFLVAMDQESPPQEVKPGA